MVNNLFFRGNNFLNGNANDRDKWSAINVVTEV